MEYFFNKEAFSPSPLDEIDMNKCDPFSQKIYSFSWNWFGLQQQFSSIFPNLLVYSNSDNKNNIIKSAQGQRILHSPIQFNMSLLTVEECELLGDSKYRSYISQVEKALKSFEYTSEWADLISALGKLNKVLLNHMKYPVIPKKVTIGKRLAQCLHPALPSGVHLKALEAYDIIFKCIGTQRLAQDLFVYSAGLFPLLAHAAMSVKPVLLTVYEKHFVPLGQQIKPGLNGLLLGLLPGLEEGSDNFDTTNTLLEQFCEAADPPFFYTGLWECVFACPCVRLPAVTFLLNHFNKRLTMEDQLYMMGLDIDLMVQALCSALQDTSVLVQRSTLDFLLVAFPMHNGQLMRSDLAKVVEGAINVVLRRDMSLNRRLYLWFLGNTTLPSNTNVTNSSADTTPMMSSSIRRTKLESSSTMSELDLTYFQTYSKEHLVTALKHKLVAAQDEPLEEDGHLAVLKPFRIIISLLDKPEIGPVIIEDILLTIFRSLYHEGTRNESVQSSAIGPSANGPRPSSKDNRHIDELIKTTNLLLSSFESYYMWEYIGRLFTTACSQARVGAVRKTSIVSQEAGESTSIRELCLIVEYLLTVVALDVYPETTTEHLPDLLYQVITATTACIQAVTDAELTCILSMCSKLLSRVQPSMATPTTDTDPFDNDSLYKASDTSSLVRQDVEHMNLTSSANANDSADVSGRDDEAGNKKVTAGESLDTGQEASQKCASAVKSAGDSKDELNSLSLLGNGVEVSTLAEQSVETKQTKTDEKVNENEIPDNKFISEIDELRKNDLDNADQSQNATSINNDKLDCSHSKEVKVLVKDLPLKSTISDNISIKSFPQQKSREDKPYGHLTLIQQCLASFQDFYHSIITHRFFESEKVCEKCMEMLTLVPTESIRPSDQDSAIDDSSMCSADNYAIRARLLELGSHPKIKPRTCTEEGLDAFARACRLLVDFASFPLYCEDYQTIIDQLYNTEDDTTLPPWLQDLLTCSCCVQNFHLQTNAIGSVLDLIILTQSVQSETLNKSKDCGRRSVSEGRVSVVILPALLPRHLQYINDKTIFYQVTAQELWHHLGTENVDRHHRAAGLFYTLHQVTPRAWICEDAIGSDLISNNEATRLDAFKKFSVLWHLTRNMKTEPSFGSEPRTFDRSMFVMLDSLKEESSAAKSLAVTWLNQVVQRADISRVLRAILLMLLHPDTARISIQHVSVEEPKTVPLTDATDDSPEANIYAISSEGGNMIFHVSHKPSAKVSRKSSEDLKAYALTVMNEKGGQALTAHLRAHSEAELSFERVNPDNLKLRINPFGSESSLDKLIFDGYDFPVKYKTPNLSGAKRLDKQTCQKEGIFFDGNEEVEPAPELTEDAFVEEEVTADLVVESLIEEILDRVMLHISSHRDSKSENGSQGGRKVSLASHSSSHLCDSDLLNAIETASLEVESNSSSDPDLQRAVCSNQDFSRLAVGTPMGNGAVSGKGGNMEEGVEPSGLHPLHMHLLLYMQPYDYCRTLYALGTIRAMLVSCPRLVVTAMATTSISAIHSPHLGRLQSLLARHRKSVFGKNFFGALSPEVLSNYRSNMFLEVVISLCLYCMRGYFPNLTMAHLTQDELLGNHLVHIQAAEVLTLLLSELLSIMRDSGRSFVSYISDLLGRCKLQKALLHTLLACVYNVRLKLSGGKKQPSLTEAIIEFNENGMDPSVMEAFQVALLRLVLVTIMLEERISSCVGTTSTETSMTGSTESDRVRSSIQFSLTKVRFKAGEPVAQQAMFLSGVLSALKQRHLCHMHRHWVALVTSALPFMGRALTRVVLCVVAQLCRNLESLAAESAYTIQSIPNVPPDHMITLLEGLTTLCHYCLLDSNTHVSIGQPSPAPASISTESASASHILTNLIHVFNPISSNREASMQRDSSPTSPLMDARNNLLSILPRIMACMVTLWKAVSQDSDVTSTASSSRLSQIGMFKLIVGDTKDVRRHILELLSPVSLLHGTHLLGAFAVAWNDQRQKPNGQTKKTGVIMPPCEDQLLLVELLAAIKVFPMDTLIQTVKAVLKQPPPTDLSKNNKSVPLEVNLLQMFFAYVQKTSASQLLDSWPSLLSLVKDVMLMGLQPPAIFILLHILNDFVQKVPSMEEKKAQKDLQDITQKLLEAVAVIAGSSLEQTTWLRRNYAVKPGPQTELGEAEDGDAEQDQKGPGAQMKETTISPTTDSKYSVQALMLLAEDVKRLSLLLTLELHVRFNWTLTAPMLDVVYSSEEKEKVVPFLTNLLQSVFPYLRHHSADNLPSFRASSQLLSSVSGYPYSRKAWRKEVLELLLDPNCFQMDARSLAYWRLVVDNLLTHDRTTFKDLMGRVSMTQPGSLNLFSSKEQEFEQRAQMLKRLSFAIFCSPPDQYQRNMPDIQERLAESLRLPQVPNVMAQVFMCFRVLILRMSSQNLISLWPTIITEMVQVFLQIEQELSTETDEFKTQLQRIAALDSSWAHLGNGLNAHNNPSWLYLYLSVCRLLDMCLVLPADAVPQFQLYRWAFIGTAGEDNRMQEGESAPKQKNQPRFTPHIVRVARLLNSRLQREVPLLRIIEGRPLLTIGQLRSIAELQPFFNTLCLCQSEKSAPNQTVGGVQVLSPVMPKSRSAPEFLEPQQGSPQTKTTRQYVEELLERDFLEPLS